MQVTKRACGVQDDCYEVKRNLLAKLNTSKVEDDGRTINIGMVFHIMYQNYDEAQVARDVQHTVDMMNKDFSKTNDNFNNGAGVYTDPTLKTTYESYVNLADSCNMNFYHVQTIFKPLSAQTSSNISILDNTIKGQSSAVSSNKYLNVWVAELSSGLLGYAQFPWELNSSPNTDGVVIAKGTFGENPSYQNFNLNKTLTHEVGHWFGLYHTFQDTFNYSGGNFDYSDLDSAQEFKGDCIIDTPPQKTPTYGNPFENPTSWPSSQPVDETQAYRHMFMDFMDYSDDIAMFMFTKDQASKMRQMVYLYRPDMIGSNPNPDPEPEPEPLPEFSTLTHGFEYGDDQGWASSWQFEGQRSWAEITYRHSHSGTLCLRTKKNGKAKISANLSGLESCFLSFWSRPENANTFIWVKPPGSQDWYSAKLPQGNRYENFYFELPGPFNSTNGQHYELMFGVSGSSRNYSYFDDITLINGSATMRLKKH